MLWLWDVLHYKWEIWAVTLNTRSLRASAKSSSSQASVLSMVLRQLTAVTSHLVDWQLESFSTASPHVRALELYLEIEHHGQKSIKLSEIWQEKHLDLWRHRRTVFLVHQRLNNCHNSRNRMTSSVLINDQLREWQLKSEVIWCKRLRGLSGWLIVNVTALYLRCHGFYFNEYN